MNKTRLTKEQMLELKTQGYVVEMLPDFSNGRATFYHKDTGEPHENFPTDARHLAIAHRCGWTLTKPAVTWPPGDTPLPEPVMVSTTSTTTEVYESPNPKRGKKAKKAN